MFYDRRNGYEKLHRTVQRQFAARTLKKLYTVHSPKKCPPKMYVGIVLIWMTNWNRRSAWHSALRSPPAYVRRMIPTKYFAAATPGIFLPFYFFILNTTVLRLCHLDSIMSVIDFSSKFNTLLYLTSIGNASLKTIAHQRWQ